jgi:hypothetical protein
LANPLGELLFNIITNVYYTTPFFCMLDSINQILKKNRKKTCWSSLKILTNFSCSCLDVKDVKFVYSSKCEIYCRMLRTTKTRGCYINVYIYFFSSAIRTLDIISRNTKQSSTQCSLLCSFCLPGFLPILVFALFCLLRS